LGERDRLHRGLAGARELVGSAELAEPALRQAYEADLAPRTEAALARVLAALSSASSLTVRRALDLGAGTGAAGAALRGRFPGVDVVAVDRVAAPGIIAA